MVPLFWSCDGQFRRHRRSGGSSSSSVKRVGKVWGKGFALVNARETRTCARQFLRVPTHCLSKKVNMKSLLVVLLALTTLLEVMAKRRKRKRNKTYCNGVIGKAVGSLLAKNLIPLVPELRGGPSNATVGRGARERVDELLRYVPPSTAHSPLPKDFDPFQPELYYRFLTYASLAYFESMELIEKFSKTASPDFYTGILHTFLMSRQFLDDKLLQGLWRKAL